MRLFIGLLLLLLWVFGFYTFFNSAEVVPTHMNYNGQVDGYGSRYTIFLLPVIATLINLLLGYCIKYPDITYKNNFKNSSISEGQKENIIKQSKILLRYYQILILLLFIFITIIFYLFTKKPFTLGIGFFVIIMILFIAPAFYFTYTSFKKV